MTLDGDAASTATLSSALGFSETVVEVGHTHPAVRRVLSPAGGTLSFLVSLDDERVVDLEVEIGLGHRGFEKEVESIPWHRALPFVARLGHAGGLMAEIGFCLAVEKLAGVALPDRAIWLRTLGGEIARVADHFARLAAVCASIGLRSGEDTAHEGERVADGLLTSITKGGAFAGWVQLGGVAKPLPEGFDANWVAARSRLEAILKRFETGVLDNPTGQSRLRDVARLSAEDCLAWSVTGPALRAAGVAMDVRRDAPYLAYGALDFDIPIGENGDNFDRVLVVVEEVRQSLSVIDQCQRLLTSLGPGLIRLAEPGWCESDAREAADASAHASLAVDGPAIPAGEVSLSTESSTGELGFFLVSDGPGLPRRIRCRGPSFFQAQAMPAMLRGEQLDDVLTTAAILHLVSGECDR